MSLRDLEKRLVEATGPSKIIDGEIDDYFSEWRNLGGWWREHKVTGRRESYTYVETPPHTASLDAAVALVERLGGNPSLEKNIPSIEPRWDAWVQNETGNHYGGAPTPALALCLALVRALIAIPTPMNREVR